MFRLTLALGALCALPSRSPRAERLQGDLSQSGFVIQPPDQTSC